MKNVAYALLLPSFLALLAAGPATGAPDKGEAKIRRLGKTVVEARDDRLHVVVGYRWASTHLSDRWIFLDTWLTATGDKSIAVDREDVALILPDGERLNLPSQRALAEGVPDLAFLLKRAAISRDPIEGYFPEATRGERLPFFTVPGEALTRDRFEVARALVAGGDLFFRAPANGFPKGRYELTIKNRDVDLRIPFVLPADDPKKGDDTSVPW